MPTSFKDEYHKRYGRQLFVVPVSGAGSRADLFQPSMHILGSISMAGPSPLTKCPPPLAAASAEIAIASLAGAYVWVTYDLILRARQNDMVTSDINRATLRLLHPLPFGFAITVFAKALP